ncbi:MAG: NADH:flavin oxidoreductase/NADH oxidase family protein [Myxococcales bacterium]|nr:MAG: NADH:flavin oxidoreductase/NADH oxidase family protein [Myxococcales bacterium]
MQKSMKLALPLHLACGVKIKNRIAKSAMSEDMADTNHSPTKNLCTLYQRWAQGGAGLLISGNIMVNSNALGEPNNVVIEKGLDNLEALKAWAEAGTKNSTQFWVQLNHPGKQSPRFLSKKPMAPSAIGYASPLSNFFNAPRAMNEEEIYDTIERFAYAAELCKKAQFGGVQIHGAHGYLLSQFLSPIHNQRSDSFGGSLENRMRFAIKVYRAIRHAVGNDFPVGIKLNSADFQKGGFSEEESMEVVKRLSEEGIDLLEISGGTYESPKMMMGSEANESTIKREAYFLEYCAKVRSLIKTPIMLTGGFRTAQAMNNALEWGACDLIGLARSLALDPDFANNLLLQKNSQSMVRPIKSGIRAFDKRAPLEIFWYTAQLKRMGLGKKPNPNASPLWVLLSNLMQSGWHGLRRVRASK